MTANTNTSPNYLDPTLPEGVEVWYYGTIEAFYGQRGVVFTSSHGRHGVRLNSGHTLSLVRRSSLVPVYCGPVDEAPRVDVAAMLRLDDEMAALRAEGLRRA